MAKAKRPGGYYLDKTGTPRNAAGERIEEITPSKEMQQESRKAVSLNAVPFTQKSVQREAEEYGLEPADFEAHEPSSDKGYTASDVRTIAGE